MHPAYHRYIENSPQWFTQLLDDRVALQPMHSAATSRWVSEDRLVSLKVLGALIALLVILERAPVPLDPAILQFFFHNRDIHAIHRDFLSEHHPTL